MRKVLETFPFLKSFGIEDQKMNNESVMAEETSKPDFVDNGLPSYNEATQVDKENEIDQSKDSVMKDVTVEELANESVPAGPQNEIEQNTSEDTTEEISCEPLEFKESGTEQATTEVEEATKETEESRPKEKKTLFHFLMFSNEK